MGRHIGKIRQPCFGTMNAFSVIDDFQKMLPGSWPRTIVIF